ncbi:MAG: hypothetical protein IKR57_01650 [Bacilli bacterium]|nr:hypothetical protein [Bacilli bacterium]
MNGNNGIVPTVDLATNNNNGGYMYPVMPMMGGYGYGNNGGFFGGDGIWAIVLLALLFGNNGFGGGWGGNNNLATTDFVSSEFTQRDISQLSNTTTSGFGNLSTQLCNCCADINSNVANGFYNTANSICGVRSDILENRYANAIGDANTQRDILMQTTQLENQLGMTSLQGLAKLDSCCCDIKQAIREDGEATRALITQNTIQDLRDRLNAAKDVISDREQTDTLLSRLQPTPTPSYIVSSPYQSLFNPNYGGCGCGNYYGTGF